MKMYKTMSVLVIAAVFVTLGVAEAGKLVDTADRTEVAHGRDLKVVPDLDQAVRVGGARIWADTIQIKDATFLKPHFVAVNLRAGDAIVVRSATGKVVETITGRGPKNMGSFWGLSARGEELNLELHISHHYVVPPFMIDKVLVGDVDPFSGASTKSVCGAADFEDVACYEGDADKWANGMASVGVINVNSTPTSGIWCSGANISAENYVLTNHHCLPTQAACVTAEFVFGYFNESCGSGLPSEDWESFRCDEILVSSPYSLCEATPSSLDFALTSVIGDPASTFGYAVADSAPITDDEGIYIVQHPLGRPLEITHGNGSDVDADSPNLRYYNTLDTDTGSSGAPIFREADHKLVGVHRCNGCEIPDAGNRGTMMSDIYPLIGDYLCSAIVDIEAVGIQSLIEVSGNGDAVLDPGETWQFVPVVRNNACTEDGLGVTADIVLDPSSTGPVMITNGAASFGDIPAGTTVASQLPVIFEVDPAAVCGDDVIFDLVNLSANNGGPFPSFEGILTYTIGELVYDSFLIEDFAAGIPVDWTVVHNGSSDGDAGTWTADNPGFKSLPLTEPFAIVDSDEAGSGVTHDEELISPVINCIGYEQVELRFNHDFSYWAGGGDEKAEVDIRSTATGGSWVNIAHFSGANRSGNNAINISPYAVGQSDVEVRFHYYDANYDYWWAIDDIEIVGGRFGCGVETSMLFFDGFESSDTLQWDETSP